MSERVALALALALVTAIGLALARRQALLHPATFSLAHSLVVGAFFPVATLFVEPLTWRNVRHPQEEVVLAVQADYLAFSLGLVLAFAGAWTLGWMRPVRKPAPPRAATRWRDGVIAWSLLLGGALLYAGYVARVGLAPLLDGNDFARKYYVSTGLGPLLFGLNLIILACLWAEGSSMARSSKLVFRLVAAAVAVWSLAFIAVRSYAAWLFLGYLYLACRRRGLQLRDLKLRILVLLVVGYAGAEGFSLLRGNWGNGLGDAIQTLSEQSLGPTQVLGTVVGGSELTHPFMTSMELMGHEEPGALGGTSYLHAFATFLPLALVPERPETLAQRFVSEYYPSLAARGGGAAFTYVGEAWWNFGPLLGPLLLGLATAAGLLALERRSQRVPDGLTARLTPYLLFLVLGLHRSASATTLKQAGMVLLPVLLLALLAELTWHALAAPARRRAGAVTRAPALAAARPRGS